MPEIDERKGRNWRAKYLTKEDFWKWVANHFAHVKVKVDIILWVLGAIFITVLGILVALIQKLV